MTPDATCRTIMHLTDERDALAVDLAALKVHQGNTVASLNASVGATVSAQQERDDALATIARVEALADEFEQLDSYRLRTNKAWQPAALRAYQDTAHALRKALAGS